AIMDTGHENVVVARALSPARRRLVGEDDVATAIEDQDMSGHRSVDRPQQCDLAVTGLRRAGEGGDVAPDQDQSVIVGQDSQADSSSRIEGGGGFELDRPIALNRLVDGGAIAGAGHKVPEMLP